MLAALARVLPVGEGWTYEPKWDGFRCLAYVEAGGVDLRSRHGKPLARYFPEVVEALTALPRDCVLDGELLAFVDGVPDFEALMARIQPTESRVERVRAESPASYVAFDLMTEGGEDLTERPFAERRQRLVALLAGSAVQTTPSTADPAEAEQWLAKPSGGAIDGVVAKAADLTYQPGKRVMVKVKRERTVECVVAGMRVNEGPVLGSLLLGLWQGTDLAYVGEVRAFAASERARLVEQLAAYASPLAGHPWEHLAGAATDWVPLRPVLVAEVAHAQVDGVRFRHPARLVRWRPDRDAASCHAEQVG